MLQYFIYYCSKEEEEGKDTGDDNEDEDGENGEKKEGAQGPWNKLQQSKQEQQQPAAPVLPEPGLYSKDQTQSTAVNIIFRKLYHKPKNINNMFLKHFFRKIM